MKLLFKILIPVLVLAACVFAARTILDNRPEPRKRPQFPQVQAVDAITLAKTNYPVAISSQGTVRPSQSTALVAEVTGTVTKLSDVFVVGGSFSKGDVLLQIDERDYLIAVTQAEANLAQASAALQEEAARGKMAKSDWDSLGRGKKASAFILRQPQLAAARANRDAARAQVDRANLDLERTRFVAPYNGRVLEKNVDLGQFVSRGAPLGKIYATNSVEVRLPLSNRQLTFADIPNANNTPQSMLPNIELNAVIAGTEETWTGKVIRAEGVDAGTQQLNVIARVTEPFAPNRAPLRIGQYVEAKIAGRILEDVFVLPRAAVRENMEVLLVNEDSKLERREVVISWLDDETAVVTDGIEAGEVLVTTPLSTVTNGTPVRATIDGKPPARPEGRPGAGGKPGGKPGAEGALTRGEGKRGDGQRGEGQRGEGQRGEGQRGEGQRGNGKEGAGQRGEGRPNKPAPSSAVESN